MGGLSTERAGERNLTEKVLAFDQKEVRDLSPADRREKAESLLARVREAVVGMNGQLLSPTDIRYGLRIAVELANADDYILMEAEKIAARYNERADRDRQISRIPIYISERVEIHRFKLGEEERVLHGYDFHLVRNHEIKQN